MTSGALSAYILAIRYSLFQTQMTFGKARTQSPLRKSVTQFGLQLFTTCATRSLCVRALKHSLRNLTGGTLADLAFQAVVARRNSTRLVHAATFGQATNRYIIVIVDDRTTTTIFSLLALLAS
jgi:hypothetical protein